MKYLCEITNKDGSHERRAVSMRELLSIERKRKAVRTLGEICEHRTFGDMCGSWCFHYSHGQCKAKVFKDSDGRKWHVWSNV